MRYQAFHRPPAFKRTLVGLALAAAFSSAWALPQFTLNPAAVGLNGSAFTADNINISDYSGVTFSDATHFTDSGFLAVTNFELGGSVFTPPGLNSAYSLWFAFTATGHLTQGTAATLQTQQSSGLFDSLTYTFSGKNGTVTFGATPAGGTCSGCAGATLLAQGSLLQGGVGSTPLSPTSWLPSAAADVTFAVASGASSFFQSPNPFYSLATSIFANTQSTVVFNGSNGFTITQGGGHVNFTSPIPEPDTYALMLGGLGVLGFLARRRRN
jgi:hypothetical protein